MRCDDKLRSWVDVHVKLPTPNPSPLLLAGGVAGLPGSRARTGGIGGQRAEVRGEGGSVLRSAEEEGAEKLEKCTRCSAGWFGTAQRVVLREYTRTK